MAVSNMMTLAEYAKGFDTRDVRRPVIEMFTQYSDWLNVMPFESLVGPKYTGYRESSLPLPVFRAINEASSTGHGFLSPFDEATFIIDHDIDIDRAIEDRHGPERRTYEQKMGITAMARLWVDTAVKGDNSANPRVFNGVQVRANKFSRLFQNSASSGGAALSLINLDNFLNNISKKSGTFHILVPFFSIPLWIAAARNSALTGFVMQTWDETGTPKVTYAGHKLLWGYPKDDQVPVLQFNEVAQGGGSAVTASLYGLTLGEGMLRGIQVLPLSPEDVGLLEDRRTFRTHIAWDVGMVDEHKFCLGRLSSWTNAPIVT